MKTINKTQAMFALAKQQTVIADNGYITLVLSRDDIRTLISLDDSLYWFRLKQ